jgi:hypothetical protein
MKRQYLFSFFILLAGSCMLSAQVTKGNKKNTCLLPLKIGNYWVYASSQSPEKRDTVRILNYRIVGTDTGYYFNQTLLKEKNDTVFEIQPQRNGSNISTVQYFSSETDLNYKILVGGDAWAGRSVKKLKEPYTVNGKKYLDCYEFTDKLYNKSTVFSKGIGIIEMRYPDQTISLIDFKVK